MKLISIIAGAALLTGCGSLSDYSQSSDESRSSQYKECMPGFIYYHGDKKYLCIDSRLVEATDEMVEKSLNEYSKRQEERQADLKSALKGDKKCMASFAKSIGIADDAHQVLHDDLFFEAKSRQYVTIAQEYIALKLPNLSMSYPQLQSVAYRNSREFAEWRQKTGQKCAKALYYSECMAANYLTELKDAEDELMKNCKLK